MRPDHRALPGPFLFLLLAFALAAIPTAARGTCIDYARYLRWEGGISVDGGTAASRIAISGSLVCVADADRLFLIDAIDPADPVEEGRLSLPAAATGLAIYGETVFVAAGSAGLVVVDAHDRSSPAIVRSIPLPLPAASVAVSGLNAFVVGAGVSSGFYAFDVSTPASPRLIGSLDIPGESAYVTASSGRAYVGAGVTGLQVIDVSRPSAPSILGAVDTPGEAVGVALSGTKAYVADFDGGLQIIDVSNPAAPRIASSVSLPGIARAVAFAGSDAYVACGSPGLVVVDLSEPVFPRIGGTADLVGDSRDIAVSGQYAYLAAGTRLLQIANVANPRTPPPLGTASLADPAQDLTVVGAFIYVAEGASGVEIVQISPSGEPSHVGTLETAGPAVATASTGEDRLIVGADGIGILIYDVTIPSAPAILGQTSAPAHPLSISIAGTMAIVAAGSEGLYLIDFSNASAPAVMSTVPAPSQAVDAAIASSGRYACVSDAFAGLQVVDLLDPYAPVTVGQFPLDSAFGVATGRPFVYIADASGVRVIDISDPASPTQMGRVELSGQPWRVSASGTTVYVVGEDQGLQVVDAEDPAAPALCGGIVVAGARAVRALDAAVYVGTSESELWIMPPQCDILPVYFPEMSAEAEGDGVRIRWDVAGDLLFDGFIVERAEGDRDEPSFMPLNEGDPVSGRGPFEYLDHAAVPGATYLYRVAGLVPGGERVVSGPIRVLFAPVRSLSLLPPAPNPMRTGAALPFELDRPGPVRLYLCDASGRRIRTLIDGPMRAGMHRFEWDGIDDTGRRPAGGVYWVRLESAGRSASVRLVTLR